MKGCNILRACMLAVFASLLVLLPQGMVSAGSRGTHTLNYFQTSEVEIDGRAATRVEIGMNRRDVEYSAAPSAVHKNELRVRMEKTRRGEVRERIHVNSRFVQGVQLEEQADGSLVAHIDAVRPLEETDYAVSEADRVRRQRLPYRLVIDVFEPQAKKPAAAAVEGVEGRTIILDAGHGGSDSGAVGPDGVTEASVTLPVAQKTQAILEASGAKVVMTRTTDVDVYGPNASDHDELQARVDVGLRTPGTDIFVSIHCNAFSNPAAHGMETYYYPKTDADYRLAALLNEELLAAGGRYNRGVKEARFYVMRHSTVPASLVELAFITNPTEEHLLTDDGYQQKLAEAIARGIARYFREG